jgi:hypothetical protein
MSTNKISPVGAYVHARGGLTNNSDDDAEAVDHFAFCPNCEREAPVDNNCVCMYCFNDIEKNTSPK